MHSETKFNTKTKCALCKRIWTHRCGTFRINVVFTIRDRIGIGFLLFLFFCLAKEWQRKWWCALRMLWHFRPRQYSNASCALRVRVCAGNRCLAESRNEEAKKWQAREQIARSQFVRTSCIIDLWSAFHLAFPQGRPQDNSNIIIISAHRRGEPSPLSRSLAQRILWEFSSICKLICTPAVHTIVGRHVPGKTKTRSRMQLPYVLRSMCRLAFTARRKTWWILFFLPLNRCCYTPFAHIRTKAASRRVLLATQRYRGDEKEPIEESEFRVCDVVFEPHIVWLLNAGIRSGNGNAFHTRRSILMSFTNKGIRMKSWCLGRSLRWPPRSFNSRNIFFY